MGCRGLLILAVVGTSNCDRKEPAPDYSNLGDFDSAEISILTSHRDSVRLRVEVAASEDQKQLGLMERRELQDGRGMIFVYDTVQDAKSAFWMYRTRIPLDIVFIDSAGRIGSIQFMRPCESPNSAICPAYPAGVRFLRALELPAGFTKRRGIGVGDLVSPPQ